MSRFMFWLAYWIATIYLKLFRGFKIYGRENIPQKGSLIVVGNHVSNLDPLVLGSSITRITRFMAKKELFKNSLLGWFLRKIGAFSVDRGRGDMEAMRTSLKILADNGVLGVFPEGTRNKDGLGKAQLGMVMIALKAKAPILPCGLLNTGNGQRPIVVHIGKPIQLTEFYNRKLSREEMEVVGELIMDKIAQQLELGV